MDNISNSNIRSILEYYFKNNNLDLVNNIYDFYQPNQGYLYCLYNEIFKFYGEDLYKCGNSNDINKRLCQYTTSYPEPSMILLTSNRFFDKSFAETLLFYYLKDFKFKPNREFIKCDFNIIKDAFDKVNQFFTIYHNKTLLIDFLFKNDNFYIYFPKYSFINNNNNPIDVVNNNDIIDYINADTNDITLNNKFLFIKNLSNQLNIDNILTYKNIFTDKNFRKNYFNFVDLINNNFNNQKIFIIHKIYSNHDIKYLSLDTFHNVSKINISDEEYFNIIKIFRSEKPKPTNNLQLKQFIISLLRNLIGQLNIFDKKKTRIKSNKKETMYFWNINNINFYIELYKKYNPEYIFTNFF
jgi:hypothetical protein